jgi:hypothetical protein
LKTEISAEDLKVLRTQMVEEITARHVAGGLAPHVAEALAAAEAAGAINTLRKEGVLKVQPQKWGWKVWTGIGVAGALAAALAAGGGYLILRRKPEDGGEPHSI